MTQTMKTSLLTLTFALALASASALAADLQPKIAGYTPAEALRLGERMYLKGILPSGEPMRAIVQGDLEVSGNMTTCSNCHQRSGMGSLEGGVVTPPTNGAKLYAPLLGAQDMPGSVMKRSMATVPSRPAYSDGSLTEVLINGLDPNGRRLNPTMPRYILDDTAAKVMTYYLKNLSSTLSPGVTDEEIRFATIVTPDSSAAERDAMILPLKAFMKEEWNDRLAEFTSPWNAWNLAIRKANGKSYRKASLDVWELQGPADTWNSQLEAYNRKKPVFALLGGMAPGKWEPIHGFCENNRIPCILPITEQPVISGSDWYTLYFSKGYYQEGEAAANYLSRVIDLPPERQVVQVYRNGNHGSTLARAFADSWKTLGNSSLSSVVLSEAEKAGEPFWQKLTAQYPGAVLLVWLEQNEMAGLASLKKTAQSPTTIFVSASMLKNSLAAVPDSIRDITFITYPTRLPDDDAYTRSIVTNWLKMKKLPLDNINISSRMYFATRLLSFALVDMGVDFYRDFFLDILDDGTDQPNSSLTYPILSFGPGQRYAAKGCYIVSVTKGENPAIVRHSDWIIF